MNFSIKLAQQLIESNDRFPVSFDLAWEWIGYSRKNNAKQALLDAGFIENEDLLIKQQPTTTGIQANLNENISLTIECFKMWAMMAKTSQGKQIRLYFLDCERIAKQSIAPHSEPEQGKLGSSVEATAAAIDPLRRFLTSVPDSLVEGFLLNRLQAHHPELKADINAAHSLLAATNPIAEILLTPTAIGKKLGVSAQVINAILTDNDYQRKNPSKGRTEPAYFPTEKGKQHSSNTLATGRGEDNTSYQHIKWFESIVEVLKPLM